MGPNRQKTQHWQSTLRQVLEGGGSIEISIDGGPGDAMLQDLVWRVRLLEMRDDEMLIAQPAAARRGINLEAGCPLVGAMSIGQNRWMFHTNVIRYDGVPPRRSIWVTMPESVERCRRRAFHRISSAEIHLPDVRVCALKDRASAVPVEIASRHAAGDGVSASSNPLGLPDVGPEFPAKLQNIGSGGLGLIVGPEHASALHQSSLFWIRLPLDGEGAAPLLMTARLSHVRMDSSRDAHAGFAFDFSMDPDHEAFIGERILEYAGSRQRLIQTRRAA